MVMAEPRQRQNFETKALVLTEDGQPVMQITLLMMDGKEAVQFRVRLDGEPGVAQGQFVKPVGLTFQMIDRKGDTMSWWSVERLELIDPASLGNPEPARPARSRGGES